MVGGMLLWYNPAKHHTTLWSLQWDWGDDWGDEEKKKKKCVEIDSLVGWKRKGITTIIIMIKE